MATTAAIYGNSQAGATGAVVEALLRADGWQVSRWFQNGAKAKAIATKALQGDPADVAIMFAGDADASQVRAVAAAYPRVVWVANPPATQIADLSRARAAFGSHVKTASHWFTSGVAAEREQDAKTLRDACNAAGVSLVDPRDVVRPFPAQPDGIHMAGQTAQRVAQAIVSAAKGDGGGWGWLWLAAGVAALARVVLR